MVMRAENCTYVLDIATMGAAAFSHTAENAPSGMTLKDLLEGRLTTKVFFAVKTDSDALLYQYGVRLRGE